MKTSKFTEAQIAFALKQVGAGREGRRGVPQARHQRSDLLHIWTALDSKLMF